MKVMYGAPVNGVVRIGREGLLKIKHNNLKQKKAHPSSDGVGLVPTNQS